MMATYLGREWTKRELLQYVGDMDQIAGIKAGIAGDGREADGRVFDVYTGSGLNFRVLVDRALDISNCRYQGVSLTWTSPVGDVHPAYFESAGYGWLRSFPGGLLTTCGLDHFGPPTQDGDENFGLHGRISNLPAYQASYQTYWQDDAYMLEISGKVRQARLFGENLLLERRITSRLGSNQILIEDSVTNDGFVSQPHMMLYHCNFGFPLIDAGTQLKVDAEKTVARDADAEVGLDEWDTFHAPTAGYREQVFQHTPRADADNQVTAELVNPKLDFKLRMRYDRSTLPQLFEWKMMGQGFYVVGVEPGNTVSLLGRVVAREQGVLPHLEPGESRSYRLEIAVVDR